LLLYIRINTINIELSIIRYSITNKDNYINVSSIINVKHLSNETQNLWRVLQQYFSNNDGALTVDDLANLFFATQPKDTVFYQEVFANLRTIEVGEHSVLELCRSLKRAYTLRKLAETAYEASEGKEEAVEAVRGLYEELDTEEVSEEEEFYTTDIEAIVAQQALEPGLSWRMRSLRQSLGPIRQGNFGVVMARVETGKTAFVLSEGTHLMEQADGYTLYLSNEEAGDAVMWRMYQATLGATREQVLGNLSKAKEVFQKRVGHKLLFKDEARITAKWLEKACERYKPKLIIVDQIDKIQGFENDREDLRLGAIYQFHREIAKEYAPVIGVTQASGDGANTKWLTMEHMSNSKTAKPAELDWLLGIGKLNDPGYENIRFMHVSKNKLPGGPESVPNMRHGKFETILHPDIVRYKDIGEA